MFCAFQWKTRGQNTYNQGPYDALAHEMGHNFGFGHDKDDTLNNGKTCTIIDLVTVFDAILTSRQTREKLQCLYENPMSNNFRKTTVLKKYEL